MSYLIVCRDGNAHQLSENPTACDYLAAAEGITTIFKVYGDRFFRLVFDRVDKTVKAAWVPVHEARVLSCPDGVLHI